MPKRTDTETPHVGKGERFTTTHWTTVLAAAHQSSPQAAAALESLCQTYWYPLYAYVRRQGHSPEDAQDLTQAFFARLLEKNYLADVDREKGKFRSFLLAALKHFLADEWGRTHALKRGGKVDFISIDGLSAEERYGLEPADLMDPEKLYERRWALTLIGQVLNRLESEVEAEGKREQFERLSSFITRDEDRGAYADVATRLGMTEGALRTAVSRLRARYRHLFREEIAHTVASPAEIEDEFNHLLAALGG